MVGEGGLFGSPRPVESLAGPVEVCLEEPLIGVGGAGELCEELTTFGRELGGGCRDEPCGLSVGDCRTHRTMVGGLRGSQVLGHRREDLVARRCLPAGLVQRGLSDGAVPRLRVGVLGSLAELTDNRG